MSNVVNALKSELESLEAEIKNDPRHIKVQRIRELLEVYKTAPAGSVPRVDIAAKPAEKPAIVPIINTKRKPGGPNSKEAKAKAAVLAFLAEKGSANRRDILDRLMERGIMGRESKPMRSLSSYLSTWKEVATNGEGMWRVVA